MKSWKKVISMIAASALCVGLLAGCGGDGTTTPPDGGNEPGGSSAEGKMFNVAMTANFTGFDPLRTNDSASTYIGGQIYETLYHINAETNEYECLLAEEFPVFSDDGRTVTIKVREGIKFHDGTDFNAEAVKYTFDLIKDPDFGSARASIANSIESIECPDEYTVVFHLKYEDGVLQAKLCHTNAAIVSPTAQQKQDLMTQPVGTGPYKFVSSISGSNAVLTRNDEYWGKAPAIKDVTFTVITEESTALARMETGEADFMPVLTVEQMGRVDSMANVTTGTSPAAGNFYFGCRASSALNPIMEEKDFRIALMKGIDKEGYVKYMMEDSVTVAPSVIGPMINVYSPEADTHGYTYDPEGAKAILDAHPGWADEELKFLVPTTPGYQKMGEYFQSTLIKAGFKNVKIESIDWSAYLTESKLDNRFDITVSGWSNVTRDGSELMEPNFHSQNGQRRVRLMPDDAAAVDSMIQASKETADMAVRTDELQKVNAILMDEAYVQPVYDSTNIFCYNTAYANITRDAGGQFNVADFTYAK